MLAQVKYLTRAAESPLPRVEVVSYDDGFLTFRSVRQIPHGHSEVRVESRHGWLTLKVDVYLYDRVFDYYQARILNRLGPAQPERRRDERMAAQLKVAFRNGLMGHTEDLSAGGARVVTALPLELGARVEVKIFLDEEAQAPVSFEAEVVWSRQLGQRRWRSGLRFLEN